MGVTEKSIVLILYLKEKFKDSHKETTYPMKIEIYGKSLNTEILKVYV